MPAATGGTGAPFWSVAIPTFNPRRDYLEAALRGVLDQDPGPDEMEILVVDDASTTGSIEAWIREIAGDRVTFHREPRNLGLAGIWNRCIERSRGKWIHILHQDDVVLPGFYQALRRHPPDAGAAFCRWFITDGEGVAGTWGPLERPEPGLLIDFPALLGTGVHVVCASIAVKRAVYESIGGFRPDLSHALDWEMWMRIAAFYPIHYHPEPLATWRVHAGATTAGQIRTGVNVRDIGNAIRIWRAYLPNGAGTEIARQSSRDWAMLGLVLAGMHLEQGDYQVVRAQLAAALSCSLSPSSLAMAARLCLRAAGNKLGRRPPCS